MTKPTFIDPFDNAESTKPAFVDPFETDAPTSKPEPKSGTIRRALGDTGVSLLKGAIGVPETVVGIADLVSGGQAGKMAESAGFKPKQAKEFISDYYSPEQKLANQKVQEADGFVNTIKAALQNPSTIAQTTAESLPVMGLGGVASRGLLSVAPKIAPLIAGAAGEGLVTAGQNAEQVRQENADGLLTGKQAAIQAGSGLLTGAISGVSGKIVDSKLGRALGLADAETMLATGQLTGQAAKSLPKAIAGGIVTEGLLEEAPQSAQEQIAQNLSLDKPWDEGVGNAAAMGALSGSLMGGGANVLNAFGGKDSSALDNANIPPTQPPAPPAPEGSLTSAATIAQAVGLTPQPVTPDVTEAKPNIVDSLNAVEAQQNGVIPDAAITPEQPLAEMPAPTLAPEQAAEKQRIDEIAHQAATSPLNDLAEPTENQKKAGNYKKSPPINFDGINVIVENPQGSIRSGVDEKGEAWSNELKNHYGYIRRTTGNDGDNIDVFLGDKPASGKVFVINQTKKDGSFDEHKAVLGAETADEAIAIYKANYADDWNGGKSVTELTTPAFKDWLKNGDSTKPLETVSATSNDVDMTKVAVGEQIDVGGVPYVKTENGFERVTSATENVANATSVDTINTLPERVDETANGVQVPTIRKGEVGGMLAAKEVVTTASGRSTTPFPNFNGKNGKVSNFGLKAVDKWLVDNAIAEAESRKDDFNLTQFKAINLKNLSQADKDGAEEYLFGSQPAVVPSILKDVVPATNQAIVGEDDLPFDSYAQKNVDAANNTKANWISAQPDLISARDIAFTDSDKLYEDIKQNRRGMTFEKATSLINAAEKDAIIDSVIATKIRKDISPLATAKPKTNTKSKSNSLLAKLKSLGGVTMKDKRDVTGEDKKFAPGGYNQVFTFKSNKSLKGLIESGDLDEYLPYNMRLEANGANDDAFDSTEAYDYLADRIRNGEHVLPYAVVEEAQANQFYQEEEATAESDVQEAATLLTEEEINEEFRIAGNEEREATAEATEFKPDSEESDTASGTGRKTEPQGTGSETSQDLLGDNTAAKQALADAERAKDAKRNSGTDNQDTFTLTGSTSESDQAAAAGAQDLFAAPQSETPAEETAQDSVAPKSERAIWIPNMTKGKLDKLLNKESLTENDIEALKDFKYFLINDKQSAQEKGFYETYKADQDTPVYVLKDKFLLTNIENKLSPAEQPKAETKPAETVATVKDETPLTIFDNAMDSYINGVAKVYDYKAAFNYVIENEKAITEYLNQNFTKQQLFDRGGSRLESRYKSEKKDRVVNALYADMVSDFLLPGESGLTSYSYGFGEDKYKSIKSQVEAITQESLDKAMAKLQEAKAERNQKLAERKEGMQDPKTLDDYTNYLRGKMGDGMSLKEARMTLTPDQRETYDNLYAERTIADRAGRKELAQSSVSVAGQTVEGSIIETKHTQKGHDLFVVQLSERVSKEDYNTLNSGAKKLGGYYSSFRGRGAVPGFQFTTKENAEAFVQLAGGDNSAAKEQAKERRSAFEDDKSQSAVERLTEMAGKLEEKADEELGRERKSNTSRRAGMAARAEANASAQKAMAITMRNIAQAIESGSAKYLGKVRQKVQVELLQSLTSAAQYTKMREQYPAYGDYEKHQHDAPTKDTADYSEFPTYTLYRSDLANLGRSMVEIDGLKILGNRILSVADDVTDAYLKFAKENIHKVSRYKTSDSKDAVFASKAMAEAAISRSGFNGKAIVLPFKRGQNMIIDSPSASKERGIWDGDSDKKITLSADLGKDIVEKIGKANRRANKLNMPWQFENAYDKREKLARMGIETPAEMRAALREFISLKEHTAAPDKIKELERKMIGRRNDGLDFFPTPASTADEMIDAADIQEGMTVLEPSAGMGHIAERIRDAGFEPDVIEFNGDRRELLELKGFNVVGSDFLDITEKYDRIIMNPPFSNRRDEEHIRHAYNLLKPNGKLVAIMGEGVFFGSDKRAIEFRDWLEAIGGTSEKLEEGTFKDASLPVNTGVNARMVVIEKNGSDNGTALFASRGNVTDFTPISIDTANAVVSRVLAANKKIWNIDIIAVPTFDALPDDVKNTTTKQYGKDEAKNASGITHKGKVYVIADMNGSEAEAESIILHEVEGHLGIHRLYGAEINKKLNALYLSMGGLKGIKDIAKQRGITQELSNVARQLGKSSFSDETRTQVMMEEMLAYTAQNPKFSDKAKAIIGMIRAWLREHGFMKLAEYGETDLLNILREGRSKLNAKVDADGNVIAVMHNNRSSSQNTELTKLKENVVAAKRQFDKMTADRRAGNLTLEQYEEVLDGVINSEADLAKALVALPDEGFALQGKTRSGNTLILAPSVKNAGQWQLSRFDERGAFGDSERKTKLEAVKLLIEEADVSTITDHDVRFSRPSAHTFYSALAKAIPLAKQDTMPAGQWKNWLVANAGKMNVKQAELQWSGLTDWLDLQQGKVSKADIQQYLDANGVQVTETMLEDGDYAVYDGDSNQYFANRTEAENYAREQGINITEDTVFRASNRTGGYGSKYAKYTVAGGENYKELLLTLPSKSKVDESLLSRLKINPVDYRGEERYYIEKDGDPNALPYVYYTQEEAQDALNRMVEIKPETYKSGHFDVKNILAHVRFDERTDADGNKVLFINELQSDWNADGRKKGFKSDEIKPLSQKEEYRFQELLEDGRRNLEGEKLAEFESLIARRDANAENKIKVPTAPFVEKTETYLALALKRMIRYAAENGFDKVAIINGQQAADLYDLSKQVDEVRAFKNGDGTFNIDVWNNGTAILEKESLDAKQLADTIGKELAEKITSESGSNVSGHDNGRSYTGIDLKVGGEGMRAFYDQIVPQVANDVLKKVGGGKVDSIKFNSLRNKNEIPSKYFLDAEDIGADEDMQQEVIVRDSLTMEGVVDAFNSIREAKAWISKNHVDAKENSQLGFTITPELRAKALEGLPLFSRPQSKFSQKSTGIDIRDLNAVVANVNQALRGLPATHVLEDYTKAPDELVADIKRDKAYDAAGAWHNGEIYLFRNNIINTNHALFTMLHESTHEGLRRVFGKDIDATLMGIYLSNQDIKQQADSLRATHKDLSLVASVEEALADMGGNGIKASVMDKLIAFVRNVLRRLGRNLSVSDSEVRAIVTRALDSVKSPSKVTHYTIGSAYSAASSGDQTNTPEFKAWFGDSKVVDAEGKPLVVYHGTIRSFNEFKASNNFSAIKPRTRGGRELGARDIFFFTDSKDVASNFATDTRIKKTGDSSSNVMPVYLTISNPFTLNAEGKNWGDIQGDVIEAYDSGKYDGAIIKNVGDVLIDDDTKNGNNYIAFNPTQIKSAIGNNGDFDPNNPDIRYSRPTPRLSPVVQPTTPNQQWQSPDKSKLDNVIYMLQNKFVDLKRVTQAIQKSGNTIEDKWNPYLLEENFTGRTAKRTKDFLKQELEPLMKSMQARKVEMADFEEYLWARHAEERNIQIAKINPAMQDGGSGMKTQDARDYLANLTPEQTANYQALAAKVDAILKNSRQRLISYGLETPETIAAWEGAYQHYVPLMREDMDNGFGNGTGQGFSVKGNASKRATGSQRAVVDVLANIAQQVERNIIRGEKNRVSTALVGLATLNPNKDFWKVDVVPKIRTVVAGKNTYEALYNGSVVQTFTNPVEANKFIQWNGAGYTLNVVKGQDLVMDVPDPSYKNRDNIVVARIVNAKGTIEEHFVEFNTHDERAMRAAASIKNLDQDQIGELLGTASSITRYFSSINTQYNPFFGVINILRDVQGSLLNLSSTPLAGKQLDVLKNTPLALKGIYQDIRSERKTGTPTNSYWSLLFEDFQKQGGQTGYRDMYRNAKERGEALKHALDPTWWQQTTAGKIVTINGILAKPEQFLIEKGQQYIFDWLSDYNESMENAVRLSAYKVALDNGMSKAQAASLAKNISVNFNRKGEMGRQIGSLYAFFNASVQGTARIGETLFTDDNGKLTLSKAGKAIVTGGLLLGVMQALMLAAAGFGDDEPPEFVRDRNLIIPLGNGKAITIAMPLGFNALPAFGRILTEWALSGGEDTSKRFFHIFEMLAEVTNPIGNAGLSMQTITPTMFDPLAALAENKDWTGRPIAKMDFNSQKPTAGHTRAKDTASAISKGLSWVVNEATGGSDYTPGALSPTPDQIDYLLGQIFGGVGREYMKLEQSATSIVTGEDLPVYKIPLVGRFYLDAEGQSSQSSRFYDNLKSVFETETELKGLRKDGLDTAEYRASHPEAALVFRANLEQREISQLYKIRSEKLKADASPDEIKALNERITARMLKFNELFKTRTTAGE